MRIALFTDSFHPELGGIQDSIAASAQALGARGHSVRVHAPRASRADYAMCDLPAAELDLGPNVVIRRLPSIPVPSSSQQSRLLVPTGRAWRALASFRPDVIHTHTFLGAGWEALRSARRLHVPIVGTNHWAVREFGAYLPVGATLAGRLGLRVVTDYYNRCAMVTAPSLSVIDEMIAFGLRRPHAVVSNPIDTTLFRPASPEERRGLKAVFGFSGATVLYAGRLATEKGIDVLIRALARIAPLVPDAMLALAGHGTARTSLERLAEDMGVGSRVKFMGTLDKITLSRAMQGADVFAIASTSETQSMVTLQAMSCGLPVVGARWRALPETIAEGAGLLATPGDVDEFGDRIRELLAQPHLRVGMGARAAEAARRSSLDTVVLEWERIYEGLADEATLSLEKIA
jgi:1,2-diacylglycerol 3-alpha-glucosyltransferase